jgi:surface protein/YD repeat-containing protein
VGNMSHMFNGTSNLTSLDLTNWDVSRATSTASNSGMRSMFRGMTSLRELTLGTNFVFRNSPELPHINVTSEFTGLWQNVGEGTVEDPSGSFVFSSIGLMAQYNGLEMADTFVWQAQPIMPEGVIAQGQFPNETVRPWRLGARWQLYEEGTLTVDEGLVNWPATNSPWHNYRAEITEIIFTGPITAGTSLTNLFRTLDQVRNIEGLENIDTSQVTNMSGMFSGVSGLTELDVSGWDTSRVTNMSNMFSGMGNLIELDVSDWDTSLVTNMSGMFSSASGLTELDVSGWDTSRVTNMSHMFSGTSSLTSLDLTNWDVSRATSTASNSGMRSMFRGMTSLRELTLGTNFVFRNSPELPAISVTNGYTGYWQNVGEGTNVCPRGEHVLTSSQLMSRYTGQTMSDTYVWQRDEHFTCNPLIMAATYQYDALGRLIEISYESGKTVRYTYDQMGNIINIIIVD